MGQEQKDLQENKTKKMTFSVINTDKKYNEDIIKEEV